ncbi:MAG: hypothetical protein QFE16_12345 [Pseudomonadota bacterium]|nr:hypothetical protein [Pseudomonadota bacterium]
MWLPDWLYERLPVLYAVTAALCLLMLGLSFGTAVSATALSAAAMTTWNLRRKARSRVLNRSRLRADSRSPR